jgi:hypothetical protein
MNCCDEYGDCTQGKDCAARCCNQDCEQGRECPARVARVRSRWQDRDPLPPATWRRYLPELARAMLYALAVIAACTTILIVSFK